MSDYQKIKDQIKFQTGVHPANCPGCGGKFNVRVSGPKKVLGRTQRNVSGGCRHCGTHWSFIWK